VNTSRVYKAFEAQDKLFRLDTHRASHSHLFDIFYSDWSCTSFVLAFNFTTLTAKGKNLQDLVQALRLGNVSLGTANANASRGVFPREASYFAFRLDANCGCGAVTVIDCGRSSVNVRVAHQQLRREDVTPSSAGVLNAVLGAVADAVTTAGDGSTTTRHDSHFFFV
jgi:hypothetical protein